MIIADRWTERPTLGRWDYEAFSKLATPLLGETPKAEWEAITLKINVGHGR